MDEERQRRLALNEALARDVNRFVDEVASGWYEPHEPIEFRCECSREVCDERVLLTRDDYVSAHADSLTFVLVPGHENLEIEEVSGRMGDYLKVRKFGPGAEVAEETDHRRGGS